MAGVFSGGWALDGAAAVAAGQHAESSLDVLNGIEHLVDHSLLQPTRGGRVGMLETIRAFALDQLALANEVELARARHAAYFADLAEHAASPRLDGPGGPALLTQLELEHDNLRAALGWLVEHEPAAGLRLAGALWSFWESRGYVREGLDWLERALEQAENEVPPAITARALIGAAALRRARGDVTIAEGLARQSTAIRRELNDATGLAESLIILATILAQAGQAEEALALAREGIALRRQHGDAVGTAWALLELGTIMSFQANFAEAQAQAENAVGLRQGRSDNVLDAWLARCLGSLKSGAGDVTGARPLLEHAVELLRARGDATGLAWSLLGLGDLLMRQTAPDRTDGRAMVEQALGGLERLGEHHGATVASMLLGPGSLDPPGQECETHAVVAVWRFALGRDIGGQLNANRQMAGPLTAREREVLALLARHYFNREIAQELVVSTRAVDRHVANIYAKIGVSNRRLATAYVLSQDG